MLISYYSVNSFLSLNVGDDNDDCYVSIAYYSYLIKRYTILLSFSFFLQSLRSRDYYYKKQMIII